jgi:hypothetical protein
MRIHPINRFFLLACLTALAACSSSPPKPTVDYKPDFDFSQVRTIGFYHHSGQVTGDNPLRLSDMQRNRADEALANALRAKGYEIAANGAPADLYLSWHLVTQEKTDVRTYSTPSYGYAGYGPYNRYAMYNCWGCMHGGTDVVVRDYTEGTFIVDMIDPTLKQSIWRSVIVSRLKGQQERDPADYDAAAANILSAFPARR